MSTKNFLLGLLVFTIFACQPKAQSEITLTLEVENPDLETEYAIRTSSSFSAEPIAKFTLSKETNSYTVSIPFPEAKMFTMSGEFYKTMYAEPGDDLIIKVTTNEEDEMEFAYEGSAAVHQELIDLFAKIDREFMEEHMENRYRHYSLPWDEFSSLMKEINDEKYQAINEAEGVSQGFKAMIDVHLWASNIMDKQTFVRLFNDNLEEGAEEMELPELETMYEDAFKYDKSALASSSFARLIGGYVTSNGEKMFEDDDSDIPWYSRQDAFADLYWAVDEDETVPAHYKEYALQHFVGSLLMFAGVDVGDEIRKEFVAKYPDNSEVESLNAQYEKWESLKAGKPALDFTYENMNGDMESLSDYYGNVIYMDVWATWCGPCIREFPSSKELKAKLADADDVIFMYVSIDDADKRDKWKEDLVKHGLAQGVNLFAGDGWESTITDMYQIQGIPRYILIDKEGKIFKSQAPRPSSGHLIYNDIQKLRRVSLEKALSMK